MVSEPLSRYTAKETCILGEGLEEQVSVSFTDKLLALEKYMAQVTHATNMY